MNSEGDIFRTSDAGATWDTLSAPAAQSAQAFAFTTPDNGILWENSNQVFTTTDGETFTPLYDWPCYSFFML